ncbi:MAG: four helix bundle protein [Patescibacteria group bacterium]
MTKAGYEYLLAYKITVPIYDYTVEFCKRYVSPFSRTTDQMVQAARSGMTNIPEGYSQQSLANYIKLSGVNKASLEELLKDYHSYARQNGIEIWEKDRVEREVREYFLTSPNSPKTLSTQ